MSAPITFPSPIGGVPFEMDFIPSIIFACLYAVAAFSSYYRLARSASRTITTVGTVIFVTERVIIFSLRAKQSKTPSEDFSPGLTQYWQMSFAIGYLTIMADLCIMMRALFVNTTKGTAGNYQTSLLAEETTEMSMNGYSTIDDQPELRARYRKFFSIVKNVSFLPIILGAIAGLLYVPGEKNSSKGNIVQILRYATTIITFFLTTSLLVTALRGYLTIPNIRKSSAIISFIIASLLNITSIYRLIVMRNHTTLLTSTAPGSLNSPTSKVTFYIFHAAPDFLAAAIMLAINVRERFSAGMFGDRGDQKPTPVKA